MAFYAASASGWTPVAHADGASALANNSYHAVRTTASSTSRIMDIQIGGESAAANVNRMALRRASTNAGTPTNIAPGLLNPLSAADVTQTYVAATTGPTIASTQHLGEFALNTFGGIVRHVAAPGEELYITASTAPNGELVLDSISGTGVVSTNIKWETL